MAEGLEGVFFLDIKTSREKEQYICATEEVAEKIVRMHARLAALHLMQKDKNLKLDLSDGNSLVDMLVASGDISYSIDGRAVITDDEDFIEETRELEQEMAADNAADADYAAEIKQELTGAVLQTEADDTMFGRMDEV